MIVAHTYNAYVRTGNLPVVQKESEDASSTHPRLRHQNDRFLSFYVPCNDNDLTNATKGIKLNNRNYTIIYTAQLTSKNAAKYSNVG